MAALDIGKIRRILVPILRKLVSVRKDLRADKLAALLREAGITPNQAVRAVKGPRADIGLPTREVALEALTSPRLTARLGAPTLTEVRGLAKSIGTPRSDQLVESFRARLSKLGQEAAGGQGPAVTTEGRRAAAIGALRFLGPQFEREGARALSVSNLDERLKEQALLIEGQKEALEKANRPRVARAAAIGIGGLLAGTAIGGTGPPEQQSKQAQALVADLLSRQVNRQPLIDAQTELTKVRTAALMAKILGQNLNAQPATVPFT